mmetsp:Transcript_34197/g.102085  ORF Transcript_34197/g.102085 Transcript_34197/m.102085 type:complete len:390 (-) Transcript_34197:241-1410(-)
MLEVPHADLAVLVQEHGPHALDVHPPDFGVEDKPDTVRGANGAGENGVAVAVDTARTQPGLEEYAKGRQGCPPELLLRSCVKLGEDVPFLRDAARARRRRVPPGSVRRGLHAVQVLLGKIAWSSPRCLKRGRRRAGTAQLRCSGMVAGSCAATCPGPGPPPAPSLAFAIRVASAVCLSAQAARCWAIIQQGCADRGPVRKVMSVSRIGLWMVLQPRAWATALLEDVFRLQHEGKVLHGELGKTCVPGEGLLREAFGDSRRPRVWTHMPRNRLLGEDLDSNWRPRVRTGACVVRTVAPLGGVGGHGGAPSARARACQSCRWQGRNCCVADVDEGQSLLPATVRRGQRQSSVLRRQGCVARCPQRPGLRQSGHATRRHAAGWRKIGRNTVA